MPCIKMFQIVFPFFSQTKCFIRGKRYTIFLVLSNPSNPQLMLFHFSQLQVEVDADTHVGRRDALVRWFGVNRIPVTKTGSSISLANDVLTIEPPYLPENCFSSNEIILARVRTLIESMPNTTPHLDS